MRDNDKQVPYTEIGGKTIAKVCIKEFGESVLYLFTDGTFSLISIYSYDEDESMLQDGHFYLSDNLDHAEDMLKLGIITQKDIDHANRAIEGRKMIKNQQEYQEYLRLKARFGDL